MIWVDDDNYTKLAFTRNNGGGRFVEFQTERDGFRTWHGGNVNLPGSAGTTLYLRLAKQGNTVRGYYSQNGEQWNEMGGTATAWWGEDAVVGVNAQGDEGSGQIYAEFDYVRFTPDEMECSTSPCVYSDEFDGFEIHDRWEIVRTPDGLDARVEDGYLVLPVAHGDIHENNQGPISFVGQPIPDGPFEVTTAVTMNHTRQWQHAGITIWKDDDNYTKLAWTSNNSNEFMEFQTEQNGQRQWHGSNINSPGNWPDTMYLRLTSDGTTLRGYFSPDGENWTEMNGTRAVWWDDSAYIGLNAQGDEGPAQSQIDAKFDFFRVEPDDCSGGEDQDTVPPVTTITLTPPANPDGTYNAPVTATLTATDNEGGSGVEKTEYRIDGGEWQDYNPLAPPTVTEPGEHTIEARSTDKAGNVEDPPASKTFEIAEPEPEPVDETAPVTTATLDPEQPGPGGTYEGPVTVNFSATDPEGDVPQTHLVTGFGYEWAPADLEIAAGDSVRWDWSSGAHDLCLGQAELPDTVGALRCEDGFERLGSSLLGEDDPDYATEATRRFDEPGTWSFYCSIHYPSMSGTVTVNPGSGVVGPASGVAKTEYRVDGGDWVAEENEAGDDPFETSVTVSDEGEHTVEFRSTDVAGNVEETKSVSFAIAEESGEDPGEPAGEPALAAKVNPKKKAVRKKAKKVAFRVRVSNTGDAAATDVRVCAKAPKKKVRILGGAKQRCQSVGELAAGATAKLRFQVKPKAKAVGKRTRIKFVVTAKDAGRQVVRATLAVRRK